MAGRSVIGGCKGGPVTDPPDKDALEDVVRSDESTDDLVLLLRGGDDGDDVDLIRRQAARLNRRFTYEGGPCFGVSVFAAIPESERWVLATRMAVRRRYYRVRAAELVGLRLLPTFNAPHWTVLFRDSDGPDYEEFVDALGELRDNPYWKRRTGRRHR